MQEGDNASENGVVKHQDHRLASFVIFDVRILGRDHIKSPEGL